MAYRQTGRTVTQLSTQIQAILSSRRHFDALPNNHILKAKQELVSLCIPHYINTSTRSTTLSIYRRLHRSAANQMDPLCRHFLRSHIWESFASSRYTVDEIRIKILLRDAVEMLKTLESARNGHLKPIAKVMDTAYRNYNVREGPLKRLLRHNRLPSTLATSVHGLVPVTEIKTFDQYDRAAEAAEKHTSETKDTDTTNLLYFKFISALKTGPARLSLGYNHSKILFDPVREGTVTGLPLPASRERNIIRRRMARVLKTARKPFDDETINYLELMSECGQLVRTPSRCAPVPYQIKTASSLRFYRRRILDILERAYVLYYDDSGRVKARIPQSNRIKTS